MGHDGKERRKEVDGEHKHGMVTNGLEGRRAHPATMLQLDIPQCKKGSNVSNQRHQSLPQRHPLRRELVNELHSSGGKVHRLRDTFVQSRQYVLRPLEEGHPRRAIRGAGDPNTAERPGRVHQTQRFTPTTVDNSGIGLAAPRTTTETVG